MSSRIVAIVPVLLSLAVVGSPAFAQIDRLGNGRGATTLQPHPVASTDVAHLVRSCRSPVSGNDGLTWDGAFLWISDYDTQRAYQVDPTTCGAVRSIPLPGSYPTGLAWDSLHLLFADGFGNTIYKLDPSDGHVVSSFPSAGPFPSGLTFTADVWSAQTGCNFIPCGPDQIARQDIAGTVLQTFAAPGSFPTGLAFDGTYLWHSDNQTGLIYKLNPVDLSVLSTFPAPGPFPNDLTWDGHFLWVVENGADMLYQYDVGAPTPTAAATWGQLKTIYR